MKEINIDESNRKTAFELWMKAPNPMVTLFKTYDVTPVVVKSKNENVKFNMLLCYLIGKSAEKIREFYTLPIGQKLYQFDNIAISVIVKNINNQVNSCDIPFNADLQEFNKNYLILTEKVKRTCENYDLADYMAIGTSAITNVEIDGAVGMYSGIFNNPFIIWGKYKKENEKFFLKISFQFHHTQMDGAEAGIFLNNLENEIENI